MLFWLYGEIMSHETEQVEVDLKVDELMDAKGRRIENESSPSNLLPLSRCLVNE
jgi:hypothetical protein